MAGSSRSHWQRLCRLLIGMTSEDDLQLHQSEAGFNLNTRRLRIDVAVLSKSGPCSVARYIFNPLHNCSYMQVFLQLLDLKASLEEGRSTSKSDLRPGCAVNRLLSHPLGILLRETTQLVYQRWNTFHRNVAQKPKPVQIWICVHQKCSNDQNSEQ